MKILTTLSSPNYDERESHPIDMLVLHYTGMRSGDAAIDRLCDITAKVSAHYVITERGDIHSLVPEDKRAWHAGVSHWRGHTNINQRSIGIELVNPGHELGYRPFPTAQMQSVLALCSDIVARHAIPARNVVGHSDVAPTRKEDPGELFDWPLLAQHGIGLWPQAQGFAEAEKLADYGYELADMEKTITAFQRHFCPQNLTGQWDRKCGALLASLLAIV